MSLLLDQMMRRRREAITGYRSLIASLSPEAYWRADDDGLDATGNGHNITVVVPASPGTISFGAGKIGSALSFNGATGYGAAPLTVGQSLTIMAGIYRPAYTNLYQTFFALTQSWAGSFGCWLYTYYDRIAFSGGGAGLFGTLAILPDPAYTIRAYNGSWFHLAIVAQPNDARIYINGTLFRSSITGTFNGDGVPVNVIDIGYQSYSGGRWFNTGIIDELSVHKSAVSESDIVAASDYFLAGAA